MKRFLTLAAFAALGVTTAATPSHVEPSSKPVVTVYKDPNCGCCKNWIEHLIKHGYTVKVNDTRELKKVKQSLGVPEKLEACHTALVGAYLVEGHVPAADIDRLLKTNPKVAGIAVPGMPAGSPGMDMGAAQPYSVLSFDRTGKTSVFARH
ncbi:MAG TPA: DUF411 domain-containing protein [Gemmatimonadaceae bacterium]|nr:DUF411 domain-containing protein [Gemmatimonadaceae bacterium]